jgi:putative redox protein
MITVTWNKGLQFEAQNDKGHRITVDTLKDFGGFEQGFSPMELLLVAIAGCMGMDIIAILQKKGGKISDFKVEVTGIRAEKPPKRFKSIDITFICKGEYKHEDLLRAHELSREKYCGVHATLFSPPEISFHFQKA